MQVTLYGDAFVHLPQLRQAAAALVGQLALAIQPGKLQRAVQGQRLRRRQSQAQGSHTPTRDQITWGICNSWRYNSTARLTRRLSLRERALRRNQSLVMPTLISLTTSSGIRRRLTKSPRLINQRPASRSDTRLRARNNDSPGTWEARTSALAVLPLTQVLAGRIVTWGASSASTASSTPARALRSSRLCNIGRVAGSGLSAVPGEVSRPLSKLPLTGGATGALSGNSE